MRNMTSYEDFPPVTTLIRVMKGAPAASLLYVQMWQLAPKAKGYSIPYKQIRKNFLISKTLFRNHLLALGRLDLLKFQETDESFYIDFLCKKDA